MEASQTTILPGSSRIRSLCFKRIEREETYCVAMNTRHQPFKSRLIAGPRAKSSHCQTPKRSRKVILSCVLLTLILGWALAFAAISLVQSRTAGSKEGTPRPGFASASATAAPLFVGTDHPVPANPTQPATNAAKGMSPNPVTTPVPQPSAIVEEDFPPGVEGNSRSDREWPAEVTREKAEQVREEAEGKRARLEALYQNRLISVEAYKKGLAEYEDQMAKYEHQIAKYHSAVTGAGSANE
jgi:hypothetical protein